MKSVRPFVLALFGLLLFIFVTACGSSATATPDPNAAKPSNPGGTGTALTLKGNANNGATIFTDNCAQCHGDQGKGGIANEGSTDGTVPALNPIDETIKNGDAKVFAANLDLFLEHGSTPEGNNPAKTMPNFGDSGKLQPQQIADVIAYIISLNK
jgi:mono/diheme cytochrome c family protein